MPIYFNPPPPTPSIMLDIWDANVLQTPPPATKPLDRVNCLRLFKRIGYAPTTELGVYFNYRSRKSPCGKFASVLLDFDYNNPHREIKEVWVFAEDLTLNTSN